MARHMHEGYVVGYPVCLFVLCVYISHPTRSAQACEESYHRSSQFTILFLRDVPVDGEADVFRINSNKQFYLLHPDDREFDFRWTTLPDSVPAALRNRELDFADGLASTRTHRAHTRSHEASSSDESIGDVDVEVDGDIEEDAA